MNAGRRWSQLVERIRFKHNEQKHHLKVRGARKDTTINTGDEVYNPL